MSDISVCTSVCIFCTYMFMCNYYMYCDPYWTWLPQCVNLCWHRECSTLNSKPQCEQQVSVSGCSQHSGSVSASQHQIRGMFHVCGQQLPLNRCLPAETARVCCSISLGSDDPQRAQQPVHSTAYKYNHAVVHKDPVRTNKCEYM